MSKELTNINILGEQLCLESKFGSPSNKKLLDLMNSVIRLELNDTTCEAKPDTIVKYCVVEREYDEEYPFIIGEVNTNTALCWCVIPLGTTLDFDSLSDWYDNEESGAVCEPLLEDYIINLEAIIVGYHSIKTPSDINISIHDELGDDITGVFTLYTDSINNIYVLETPATLGSYVYTVKII